MTQEPESKTATAEEGSEHVLPQPREEELPGVLEALLFATTAPLSIARLAELTSDVEPERLTAALDVLRARYSGAGSGLMLMEVAGGFQLATRAEVADWVLALHRHRRKNPLSPAVLETLAIVAYKQPIVKAEIESIRGVDCGGVLRALQDAGLVEVVGHKEVVGRPSLYGTSENFLKTFGLRNLDELPSLSDLQHILHAKMKGREGDEAPAEEPPAEEAPAPEGDAPDATV